MVESLSYPFVGDEDFKAFSYDPAVIKPVSVEIANPLAGDRPYLRRDVLPTLATTVQRNLRRGSKTSACTRSARVPVGSERARHPGSFGRRPPQR